VIIEGKEEWEVDVRAHFTQAKAQRAYWIVLEAKVIFD